MLLVLNMSGFLIYQCSEYGSGFRYAKVLIPGFGICQGSKYNRATHGCPNMRESWNRVRHKRNYDLSGDGVELDSNNCKNFMTFFGQKIAKNGQIA